MLENLVVRLIGDGSSYTSMMTEAAKQAAVFEKQMGLLSTKLQSVGKATTAVGKKLTIGLTLPIVAAGAATVKAATDMNAAMANIATLGVGGDRLGTLKTDIQEIAIAVGKSTADIATGMFQVISAFGDTSESAAILNINARAAAAGMSTTLEAINLTSAVTKGFGDTSAAAIQKVADLAFITNKLGQTTFPELARSVQKVVPLMASLGGTQEELFAVMATATGVTGNAKEVSTQLRGVLQALLAPSKDGAKAIRSLGFSSGAAMVKQLGLMGSIQAFTKAAEESGKPLQKFMGSIEGQTLALALTGAQADIYTEKLAAMMDVTGATDAAFLAQTQGVNALGFSWVQAGVRAQVLAQKIGDALLPSIISLQTMVSPVIASIARWTENNGGLVIGIAAVVAIIGPMLIISGQLVTAIGVLLPIVVTMGTVFASTAVAIFAAASPLVLTVAAVLAIIAVAVALVKIWDALGGTFIKVASFMADAVLTSITVMRRLFTVFFGWVAAQVWKVFNGDFIKALISGIGKVGTLLKDFTVWIVKKIVSMFTGIDPGKFFSEVSTDLSTGANIDSLGGALDAASGIVAKEFGDLRARQSGSGSDGSSATQPGIGQTVEPVQAMIAGTAEKSNGTMEAMKKDTADMVGLLRQTLEKEGIELAPLGLSKS